MQFRKPHMPSAPRTSTYSSSLLNKSATKKKTVFTQTEELYSPFDEWFESRLVPKDKLTFDENATQTYSKALEYINNFHSYMNKKLSEKYGQCGDTNPEGRHFFKLPEVPNYVGVFLILVEKNKDPNLAFNRANTMKIPDGEAKYTTNHSVIEFVQDIKNLPEYKTLEKTGALEEIKNMEQEVQTIIGGVKDEDSLSCPSKSQSEDISLFSSKKSATIKSASSMEVDSLEKDKNFEVSVVNVEDAVLDNEGKDKEDEVRQDLIETEVNVKKEDFTDLPLGLPQIQEEVDKSTNSDDEKIAMIDIIRQHVQEEITVFLDRNGQSFAKEEARPKLMRSHFHVVNIPPQINLLEYAQKKLERQLNVESRPVTTAACSEMSPQGIRRQPFPYPTTARKSINIRPNTPKRVTNMFRRLSQENFRDVEMATRSIKLLNGDCEQSDDDSIILDDEEFEKINGPLDEQMEKKQKRGFPGFNISAIKEKSNPLKLTLRDMTRVDEKMLHTIGLFTERGDIRPGVIDILEEQKKAKAKDTRNKQFRSRRQWDLQIHLDPKGINSSFTSVSTEKSFISLSSTDLRSDDVDVVKNVSQQVDYGE